jgi:hypothetical protein
MPSGQKTGAAKGGSLIGQFQATLLVLEDQQPLECFSEMGSAQDGIGVERDLAK